MENEWRPPDWDSIKHSICGCEYAPGCGNCSPAEIVEKIASAMLSTRDADWITWGEGKCFHVEVVTEYQSPCGFKYSGTRMKVNCSLCWVERKKEIEP